jgi:hypothetical protein
LEIVEQQDSIADRAEEVALNLTFRQPARSDDQAADSFSSVAGGLVEAGLPWRRCEARAGAELPVPIFWEGPSGVMGDAVSAG